MPLPLIGFTSMRPSLTVRPFVAMTLFICRCCPPLSDCVNSVSFAPSEPKMLTSAVTGLPEPSTRPKFVRYAADCATCCRLRTVFASLPMKLANGMAGMNCPNVPFAVLLKVRLAAKVVMFGSPPTDFGAMLAAVPVSGRISRVPVPDCSPNQLCRTSSRAMVRPGSMLTVVWKPSLLPWSPLGVKVS